LPTSAKWSDTFSPALAQASFALSIFRKQPNRILCLRVNQYVKERVVCTVETQGIAPLQDCRIPFFLYFTVLIFVLLSFWNLSTHRQLRTAFLYRAGHAGWRTMIFQR
jgi:hypothetical protein